MVEPINIASADLLDRLSSIEPGVYGTPCSVRHRDGRRFELALAWENRRFGDAGDWINPQDVTDVEPCAKRMPASLARRIHEAGESGMGYHVYVVLLADGNSFVHVAPNLGIDFVDLPAGYVSQDIVDVECHAGRDQLQREPARRIHGWASVEFAR